MFILSRNIEFDGSAVNTLESYSMSAKNGELEIHPESGYEFDKFANTTGKDDTKTNDLIKYLKSEHEKFQETEADVCITCLKQQVKKI